MNWLTRFFGGEERKSFTVLGGAASGDPLKLDILNIGVSESEKEQSSVLVAAQIWLANAIVEAKAEIQVESGEEWVPNPSPAAETVDFKLSGINPATDSITRIAQGAAPAIRAFNECFILQLWDEGHKELIGLRFIPNHLVKPETSPKDVWVVEKYYINGTAFPAEDVIHIRVGTNTRTPANGYGSKGALARPVQADITGMAYSHRVTQSPTPGLLATPGEGNLGITNTDAVASMLKQVSSGEKAGSVVCLSEPIKIERLGFSPEQLALDKLIKLPEERICAIMGVSPILLGLSSGAGKSTYSNYKEAREAATEQTLIPIWQMLSNAITGILEKFDPTLAGSRYWFCYEDVKAFAEDTNALAERVNKL